MENKHRHYKSDHSRDYTLNRLLTGLNVTINLTIEADRETNGGVIDINEEFEHIYGLALIAMQNYISMTCADCITIYDSIANNNKDKYKEWLNKKKNEKKE